MKQAVVGLGVLSSSLFFAACSSAPPPSPGQTGPTVTTQCSDADKSPGGVCYPTQDIGTGARSSLTSANGTSGQRIANFAFTGYAVNDTSVVTTGTTTTIHLANFYNPDGKATVGGVPIKVIHLTVAAVWCNPCNEETDFISGGNWTGANASTTTCTQDSDCAGVPGMQYCLPNGSQSAMVCSASFAKELAPLGVVFLQALSDGQTFGVGATISDLDKWINHHKNDFSTVVDPGIQNLGVFFDGAAVPFNMNIDARSMEILSSELGFDTNMNNTIKNQVLPWIDSHPAKQ